MTSVSTAGHPVQSTNNTARSRSLRGCSTCRSRHVKCDERQPICLICESAGLRCGGYEKNIFFASNGADQDILTRFRRPLLTEKERENMSKLLTASVPPKKAFKLLSQLDDECENASLIQDIAISHGPFGAFRIISAQLPLATDTIPDADANESPPELITRDDDNYACGTQFTLSPWTQEFLQTALEPPEVTSLQLFPNVFDMEIDPNSLDAFGTSALFQSRISTNSQFLLESFGMPPPLITTDSDRTPIPTISPLASSKNNLPPNALPLIQHYSTIVINAFTPFRHTKTPWHILFLPYIRQCLAILVLNDHLDHAGMCIFYGALSLSACSLGGSTQTLQFSDSARMYANVAQQHAQIMLQQAYSHHHGDTSPKKFKYKSMLMALLTLVHSNSISLTNQQNTERYLLECEKLIRLRGLTRCDKSRKIRLLHHCYAFTRVLHESTAFLFSSSNTITKTARNHVRHAVEANILASQVTGSDMPASFRIHRATGTNWAAEMKLLKPQHEGENDLHLERPGHFPATLYPEIFGLPEPWLLLLSQVIRLGNEKEAAENNTNNNDDDMTAPLELREFTNRARAIERAIVSLDLVGDNDFQNMLHMHNSGNMPLLDPLFQRNILLAMQDALAIYFYRRIYDLHTSMLQDKVRNVLDAMLRVQLADHAEQSIVPYGSAGFMWPVFIAACEAEDESVQFSFSQWLGHYAQRSGLPSFTSTLAFIQRVWAAKGERVNTNVSWLEVMKNDTLLHEYV